MHWDKKLIGDLLKQGFTREQAGIVVGIVAEEKQAADRQGYKRGYQDGHDNAKILH